MSDRVALGRVHAALVSLPGVRDAAVHVTRDASGGRRIVAHMVTHAPLAELRAALESRLPAHLVPARFHRVPHIPLLPDGSTDRQALAALTARPGPESGTAAVESVTAGPESGTAAAEPGIAIPESDAAASEPGTAAVESVTAGPEPGAAAPKPGAAAEDPVTATPEPGTATPEPGTAVPELGTAIPPPPPETVPLTPQQHTLLLDALAHGGTGRHVEQLDWRWRGPLDTDRFTAAWQSVFDRETVLRAAFDWGSGPRLVLHEHAGVEVVRHPPGSVDFDRLRERDRLRGFDLRRPGLLRLNLVDEPPPAGGGPAGARVLLTFHHVMLDGWSVSVLLQEFYRAYLAGGRLPGGERRPDIRDYARWLARQDTAPARDFWSSAIPATTALVLPAVPGPDTGLRGTGRAEARLEAGPADRLRAWAASCAATEAGALQVAWALLLYRAAVTRDPALVGFGVTVPGRGIALDSVERLPGPLMNSLPMTVRVDPATAVPRLLAELCDRALDLASYEWVSLGQIHEWSGRRAQDSLAESLIVFENRRRRFDDLYSALAAQGVGVEPPRASGVHSLFPVSLFAHRDPDGGLALAAVHDRARLADDDATRLVGQCVRLLCELPRLRGGSATVADALATLADEPRIRMARAPAPAARDSPA
ncbi:condensation domain-containing protein [Streptomyces coelicoflavus]